MAYTNPGAAAVQGLQEWVTARDAKLRQSAIDDLNKQKTLLEIQAEQDKIKNEEQDRARSDFKLKTANLMPGDVPDAMTIAEGDKLGMPLPIKVQPGNINEGPMPDGSIVPPDPDKNIYLGDRNYQMAQRQAADTKTAADAKHQQDLAEQQAKEQRFADAIGDGTKAPREVIRDIVKAGYTTEDAKRVIDSMQTGVPVYKNNRDGSVTQYDPASRTWVAPTQIQEKAHWITEPAPTNINVNGAAGASTDWDAELDKLTPGDYKNIQMQVQRGALAGSDDPAFGSGTVGARSRGLYNAMVNREAEALGLSGSDLAERRMRFRARQASVNSLQKSYDAIESFSEKGKKDLTGLQDSMTKIPDWSWSVANRAARGLDASGLMGRDAAAEMKNFQTRRQTVKEEFTRILSSPSGGGVITQQARDEMNALVDPNASVQAIQASLDALMQEVQNRHMATSDRLETAYGQGGRPPGSVAVGAPPPASTTETPEQRRQRLLNRGYLKP